MTKRSDVVIIQQLQSAKESVRDDALTYLYEISQPLVRNFILKNRGNEQDVEDIFHDGLIAFYNLAIQHKLRPDTNVEAYLYSICRNIWKKKLVKSPKQVELTEVFQSIPTVDFTIEDILSEERQTLLATIFKQLGEDCQKLLHLFYYEQLRMKAIVKEMNFTSDQVARNKKLECMKKLRSIILESSFYKNMFRS